MRQQTKTILNLTFFFAYGALMLYEGVFKEIATANNWHWFLLFIIGAGITYWAHRKNGIITIALLFVHTTLELAHHGAEFAALTAIAGIVFAVHFLFDCGFLWSEIKHHAKNPTSVFVPLVLFYGIIFVSSAWLGGTHNELLESTEVFSSAITGGIFACVLAHSISIIKRTQNHHSSH